MVIGPRLSHILDSYSAPCKMVLAANESQDYSWSVAETKAEPGLAFALLRVGSCCALPPLVLCAMHLLLASVAEPATVL